MNECFKVENKDNNSVNSTRKIPLVDNSKCDSQHLLEIDDSIFGMVNFNDSIHDDNELNSFQQQQQQQRQPIENKINIELFDHHHSKNVRELKRKSSDFLLNTPKRSTINDEHSNKIHSINDEMNNSVPVGGETLFSQLFDTELFKQIDDKQLNQDNDNECNVSQYFNTPVPIIEGQLDQIQNHEYPSIKQQQQQQNTSIEKLNLTQIFMDDVDDVDFEDEDEKEKKQQTDYNDNDNDCQFQCSQMFLNKIHHSNINIIKPKLKLNNDKHSQIHENHKNASVYIQRQRTMHDENEINLNDEYLDSQLSQAYKSTQYHREVVSVFDECEKSICNISSSSASISISLNDKITTVDLDHKINCKLNSEDYDDDDENMMNKRLLDIDEMNDLNDINWTTTILGSPLKNVNELVVKSNCEFETTSTKPTKSPQSPLITPSTVIRERLKLRAGKNLTTTTTSPSSLIASSFKSPPPPAPISTLSYVKMGPYFGLPMKVKALIKDFKGIDELYDWQIECLQLPAVHQRHNLIYALPTSGGKTLVAEIIILKEIICRRKNVIFILPYVSIVQEKIWALSPFAVALDFLIEEYAAGKGSLPPRKRRKKNSVFIATIEKGLALFDSLIENDRANEIGLVVVDELHIIGELGRGATLETLLTKIKFINAGIQIIGMSATIGNLNEIAQFLESDTYTRDFRPVELKEFIKCGKDILEINSNAHTIDDAFKYTRTIQFNYNEDVQKMDPDHIAGLVTEIIPNDSCLIFCPSKKNCENLTLLLSNLLSKKYLQHKKEEKQNLLKSIEADSGPLCKILKQSIPMGIAYHHSGLTADERRHLEDGFRLNIITVICCTSTLAAGVNLPAKRVIIRSPYIGRDFITLSRYKQMIGRAGRTGMLKANSIGESILICSAVKDNLRITNLLCSPMDEACTCMHLLNGKGLSQLILSTIGLELTLTRNDIKQLIDKTLFGIQAVRLNVNKSSVIDSIIRQLLKEKAINVKLENCLKTENVNSINNEGNSFRIDDITIDNIEIESQLLKQSGQQQQQSSIEPHHQPNHVEEKCNNNKIILIKSSTKFETSKLGKAAFKSCIDLIRAKIVYKDLQQAQKALVLNDYLHLLYLVTPYEPNDLNLKPDMTVYYQQYLKLESKHVHTARIIGITESCAINMMSGKVFKGDLDRTVNKFFFTLILYRLWQLKPIHEVADEFHVSRGIVQNLIQASASFASCLLKFCEELNEFWAFKELLGNLTKRLSYCCTIELIPLMELPCVKLARAKQLFAAGYRNLQSIAKAKPNELVLAVEHLNNRIARQLISSAKILLLERVETLREEVQECLDVLENRNR